MQLELEKTMVPKILWIGWVFIDDPELDKISKWEAKKVV